MIPIDPVTGGHFYFILSALEFVPYPFIMYIKTEIPVLFYRDDPPANSKESENLVEPILNFLTSFPHIYSPFIEKCQCLNNMIIANIKSHKKDSNSIPPRHKALSPCPDRGQMPEF